MSKGAPISTDIIEEESIGISEDIMDESIGISDDIIDDESIGISLDIIEESIAEDSIELMEESCAKAGMARTAASAVVARRVRIMVGSRGSTHVGCAARCLAWLGSGAARFYAVT
jgi:hypothetical protein